LTYSPTLQQWDSPQLLGHHRFRAMNTTIEFFTRDTEQVALFPLAEAVFHAAEARLSRFLPDSELCDLNRRSGHEVEVSQELFSIVERAIYFYQFTGGIFNPAILSDLEMAGYDRSFEKVAPSAEKPSATVHRTTNAPPDIRLDRSRSSLTLPLGMRLDLGGIGKGHTVDEASLVLSEAHNFVVNAGGDIFASGSGADGDGWLVAIDDPRNRANTIAAVRLYDEALATSTTAVRRWKRGGAVLHHLIDPETGRPSESGVLSVSVVARQATEADVFAKTALLLGHLEGVRFLQERSVPGLFVMDDDTTFGTKDWNGSIEDVKRRNC